MVASGEEAMVRTINGGKGGLRRSCTRMSIIGIVVVASILIPCVRAETQSVKIMGQLDCGAWFDKETAGIRQGLALGISERRGRDMGLRWKRLD